MELEVNEYSRLEPVKEEIRARVDTQVDAAECVKLVERLLNS